MTTMLAKISTRNDILFQALEDIWLGRLPSEDGLEEGIQMFIDEVEGNDGESIYIKQLKNKQRQVRKKSKRCNECF